MKETITQESAALSVFLESLLRDMPETAVEAPAQEPQARETPAPTEETPPPPAAPVTGADRLIPEGSSEFKAMLMDLGGMQVAAALTQLGSVIPWPEDLTDMPGRAPWMRGVTRHRGRNIKVVDLRHLLTPPGRAAEAAPPTRIVIAHDRDWGLACAGVSEVVTLNRGGVQWRGNRRHPWLLGTVVGRMSVLLDVEAFVRWLETGAPGR